MTRVPCSIRRPPLRSTRCAALLLAAIPLAVTQIGIAQEKAQAAAVERTYHQPKVAVEKALKELQPSLAGHLPVLDGFALPGDHPLNRYQRAYYQSAVQMSSTAAGGTLVRVTTKVTAWYADSNPSHSGYQLLASNGRLESDLLDQLTICWRASPVLRMRSHILAPLRAKIPGKIPVKIPVMVPAKVRLSALGHLRPTQRYRQYLRIKLLRSQPSPRRCRSLRKMDAAFRL